MTLVQNMEADVRCASCSLEDGLAQLQIATLLAVIAANRFIGQVELASHLSRSFSSTATCFWRVSFLASSDVILPRRVLLLVESEAGGDDEELDEELDEDAET